jgi:hypothetical protein
LHISADEAGQQNDRRNGCSREGKQHAAVTPEDMPGLVVAKVSSGAAGDSGCAVSFVSAAADWTDAAAGKRAFPILPGWCCKGAMAAIAC